MTADQPRECRHCGGKITFARDAPPSWFSTMEGDRWTAHFSCEAKARWGTNEKGDK